RAKHDTNHSEAKAKQRGFWMWVELIGSPGGMNRQVARCSCAAASLLAPARGSGIPVDAVESFDRELFEFDAGDASKVDCPRFRRESRTDERMDAAMRAEVVRCRHR